MTLAKIANAVMLVLFVSWAGFQYNDPDALLWILIYAGAAIACILYFLGRLPVWYGGLYMAFCIAYAAFLGYHVITMHEFIFEEQGREMMGLLIAGGWAGFLTKRVSDARRRPEQTASRV